MGLMASGQDGDRMLIHIALTNDDGIWVAQSIEFDVASQGATQQEA
jgi:hypothetical protein